ncbi:MAG: alkyl hydroperoxide reductase subunit F, partial [Burkholderiaceae bacterium]
MLDTNLRGQLKAYLERVKLPFEIIASLDDSAAAQEMHGLLTDIVSLCDKITL